MTDLFTLLVLEKENMFNIRSETNSDNFNKGAFIICDQTLAIQITNAE